MYQIDAVEMVDTLSQQTPHGLVTDIQIGRMGQTHIVFFNRHGKGHTVPPHKVNYRANMWAIAELGVKEVLSFNAVGGIHPDCAPATYVTPHQVIDYTYGREYTFADALCDRFNHIDFTQPFSASLRDRIASAFRAASVSYVDEAVYGCTQGPRLETAAEIKRLSQDGCDLVGMTLMPEAALARELDIEYASVCTVVNWAAGISQDDITLAAIIETMTEANAKLQPVITQFLSTWA